MVFLLQTPHNQRVQFRPSGARTSLTLARWRTTLAGSTMKNLLSILLVLTGVAYSSASLACEESLPCEKCAKESEYSWNPNNRYVTARLNRFYSLDDKITEAYEVNDFDQSKALLAEYLELADIYRCNWNYGNAIHDANRILGLISLKDGNIDEAVKYLLASGKSTGSPQLDTFGPELDLANELLKLGKKEEVKAYLLDISSFWEMDDGSVDRWVKEIANGELPELNRFSGEFGFWQQLMVWISLVWPILITALLLYVFRAKINRKWVFGITGIATGYAAMFIVSWVSTPILALIIDELGNSDSDRLLMLAIYSVMSASYWVPALVVFGVSRLFSKTSE